MEVLAQATTCRFDDFLLDLHARALFRLKNTGEPTPISLGSRAFSILCVLIERRGEFVSKHDIMHSVWPKAAVEDSNLTVQMSALRRVLDVERGSGSCIRMITNRGYCFLPQVDWCVAYDKTTTENNLNLQASDFTAVPVKKLKACDKDVRILLQSSPMAIIQTSGDNLVVSPKIADQASRFSVFVMPFKNLGGSPDEDDLAISVTEDLTTDLCLLDGLSVFAASAAGVTRDQSVDVRRIGEALGVHYVVEGSLHKLGDILRINARLIDVTTNTYLWACRFDHKLKDVSRDEEEVVSRLKAELIVQLLKSESARSMRERPDHPDAFDLTVRARSLLRKHDQTTLLREVSGLLQRALNLNPTSAFAMCELASQFINRFVSRGDDQGDEDLLKQATTLITAAAAIEPNSESVIFRQGYLFRALGRWTEAIATLERLIQIFPHASPRLPSTRVLQNRCGSAGSSTAVARAIDLSRPACTCKPARLPTCGPSAPFAWARC